MYLQVGTVECRYYAGLAATQDGSHISHSHGKAEVLTRSKTLSIFWKLCLEEWARMYTSRQSPHPLALSKSGMLRSASLNPKVNQQSQTPPSIFETNTVRWRMKKSALTL